MKPQISFTYVRSIICLTLILAFVVSSLYVPQLAQAGEMTILRLPSPGIMVHLSPEFTPAHLQGLTIHPENALQFDFLIHQGDGQLDEGQKKEEYTKLVKYFLASLTIPDEDQWVNLSPYEQSRIIKENFGKTEMGRDLLSQDYLLKQITSSLMYPEDGLGKKFWDKVYERAYKEFGTSNIPVNTFNKVWIIPDEAAVYESGNTVYILRDHLKVMLEEDYLSLEKHSGIEIAASPSAPRNDTNLTASKQVLIKPFDTHTIASKIVKEIILPELEKEVNEGKNFAMLRQIYSGMILATWYKHALKDSLLGKVYANQAKVSGVDQKDPQANQAIYQRYLRAFKKGVFNFIKEDTDKYSQQLIPRKYFAGGMTGLQGVEKGNFAMIAFQPRVLVDYLRISDIAPAMLERISSADLSSNDTDSAEVILASDEDEQINRAQLSINRVVSGVATNVALAVSLLAAPALTFGQQANNVQSTTGVKGSAPYNQMDVINGYIHRFGASWIAPDKLFAFDKTADDILKGELSSIKDPRDQVIFKDFYTRLVIEAQAWLNEHDPKLFTYDVIIKLANNIAGQYKGVTVSGNTTNLPKKTLVLDPFFKGVWTDFVTANVNNSKNRDAFNKKAEAAADYIDKRLGDIVREMVKAFAALNESPYGKKLQGDELRAERERIEQQRKEQEQKVQGLIQQFNDSYLFPNGRLIAFRYNDEYRFSPNYSIQAYMIKDRRDVQVLGDPVRVVRAERVDLTGKRAEFSGFSLQGRGLILIDLSRAHDAAWDLYNATHDSKLFAAQFPQAKAWFNANYKGAGSMANIIKIMEKLILAHELGHQLEQKLSEKGLAVVQNGSNVSDSELVARIAEGLVNSKFALSDHFTDLLPLIQQNLDLEARMKKDEEEDKKAGGAKGGRAYLTPDDPIAGKVSEINYWLIESVFGKDSKEKPDSLFNDSFDEGAITGEFEKVFTERFTNGQKFVDEFRNVSAQINQAMVHQVKDPNRMLKDVERIHGGYKILQSREHLKDVVEEPLLEAAQILYDKGITTVYSSASPEWPSADIGIDYNSLSEVNKKIALRLGRLGKLSHDGGPVVFITIAQDITPETPVDALIKKSTQIAHSFEKQSKSRIEFGPKGQAVLNASRKNSTRSNKAMKANLLNGGIDFNSANLHLQIKRDGRGVPLPLLQQDWAQLSQIDGFVPTIIEIRPATHIPILSEIQQKLQRATASVG
jgi:hypothetical protein